ncbi:MAG: hypothetical protein IPM91_00080 [Bacteroidetes bacterium]|nr:hypothetical protein [Bacteroidota bacterium]
MSGATTASGSGTGSGSAFNIGLTTVTITAGNSCSQYTICSFTVTVNAPLINVQGNSTTIVDGKQYSISSTLPILTLYIPQAVVHVPLQFRIPEIRR